MSQWASIQVLASEVKNRQTSAVDLVNRAFKTIEEQSSFDAVLCTLKDEAIQKAVAIDADVAAGTADGALLGVPFIAKDNFLVYGGETTAASNMLRGFQAPYQATAIERLEAAGAICVAKANLDAFAHGSSTENSDFMVTKNPHDKSRVPGGSSGGSAAAVILDMVPFALGTDTGGSIRLPASFCGAVGYKPTYGLVSRSGVVAMASSTDTIGPLTRNVQDAASVLDVLAGIDPLDSTTVARDEKSYSDTSVPLRGARIGIVDEYFTEGLDPAVKAIIDTAITSLEAAGAHVSHVSLPTLPLSLAVYYVLCPAEVSSNLSRYDGQRFGHEAAEATTLEESYSQARSTGFGQEAKRRIMTGTYVLSSGYYDAYYKKAQLVRTKLMAEFQDVFSEVDYLLGPTSPITAFKIGERNHDPLAMYLVDICTVGANLVGCPAISIPAGNVDTLPVGLQLMAAQHHDRELLSVASHVEAALL